VGGPSRLYVVANTSDELIASVEAARSLAIPFFVYGGGSNVLSPRIVRRVISEETAVTMRKILSGAVENGTGSKAGVNGYSVAGKTGTAQKIDPATRKYHKDRHVASFCGFLPAERPALVCLVVLDEPKKTYWGGEAAAPVFARVMSRAAQILGIPPDARPALSNIPGEARPELWRGRPALAASGPGAPGAKKGPQASRNGKLIAKSR
jgi:membrane peptidoglycan carboxypeptidase